MIGGVIVAVVAARFGVIAMIASLLGGNFHSRYYIGSWQLFPYNPSINVIFAGY